MMLGAGMALATATASAADVYIIGSNVNGHCWELEVPECQMTETSPGVYEWDGAVLGSGFKFNDGTWDGNFFEGTDVMANLGSNGDELVLNEPYYFEASGSSGNIMFQGLDEVQTPHVVLDLNEGWVTVTGDAVETPEHPEYYLVGSFNDWFFQDNLRFTYEEDANAYRMYSVPFDCGICYIKVATAGWRTEFGANDENTSLTVGEVYQLSAPGNYGVEGDLYGVYDITFNLEAQTLLFEKVGEIDPVGPVGPDYYSFQLEVMNPEGTTDYWLERRSDYGDYFIARNVTMRPGDEFYFAAVNGDRFGATGAGVVVSDENPTCDLTMFSITDGFCYTVYSELDGTYDVEIDFDGALATVRFVKVEEYVPDYAQFNFVLDNNNYDLEATEEANVFKLNNVDIYSGYTFMLRNYYQGQYYAVDFGECIIRDLTDPLVLDYIDNDDYMDGRYPYYLIFAVNGTYDITINFTPEIATLEFTKVADLEPRPIDYANFQLQWKNLAYDTLSDLEATEEENVFKVSNVSLAEQGMVALTYRGDRNEYFAVPNNVFIENNECTLYFWNGTQGWSPFYALSGISGVFDIYITFSGEEATLRFEKVSDLEFNPAQVNLVRRDLTTDDSNNIPYVPSYVDGNTVVYENQLFTDATGIYFLESVMGTIYAGTTDSTGDYGTFMEYITPTHLSATAYAGADQYILVNGLSGNYDITIEFNEDHSAATVTFSKTPVPEVVATYEGDLYVVGNVNGWTLADPDFKMTCIEPGLYEWSGEALTSGFKINGGDWYGLFPDTDLYIDFGGFEYPATKPLYLDQPYALQMRGADIFFDNTEMMVKNPKVTLDLREMTLLVTGEEVAPPTYADYDGPLYIIGEINNWTLADPAFEMTKVAPGVYEWNGPSLSGEFKINSGAWDALLPGTDLYLDFGGYDVLYLNETYYVAAGSGTSNITLSSDYSEIKNAAINFNLNDMTLYMGGTPVVGLNKAILFTNQSAEYMPVLTEAGVVYENVHIDGELGLAVSLAGVTYGWPDITEDTNYITESNLETEIVSSDTLDHWAFFVYAYLEGLYSVYVDFNEDRTKATMRFVKTGEIYPYVNVEIENGTTFSFRSQGYKSEKINVNTNDEFWGISGYRVDDEEDITFANSLTEASWTVYVYGQDVHMYCYTEYLGECKILSGSVGMVEFDNAVTIERVAEGVEIHNVEVGADIAVYTLGGQLVQLMKATDPDMTVKLEKGQAFIVRAGNVAAKVLM